MKEMTVMKYRITTRFETLYTHEIETKVERTNDLQAALGAYIIYIENPEVVFSCIDRIGDNDQVGKIIAAYNPR